MTDEAFPIVMWILTGWAILVFVQTACYRPPKRKPDDTD